MATGSEMAVIKLSGALARRFGRCHWRLLDSGTVKEVFSAMRATLPGFDEEIKRLDSLGMRFAIFRNGKNVGEGEFNRVASQEVRIVPVLAGNKRGGLLQTIVEAVMIVAGVFPRRNPIWRSADGGWHTHLKGKEGEPPVVAFLRATSLVYGTGLA